MEQRMRTLYIEIIYMLNANKQTVGISLNIAYIAIYIHIHIRELT